MSNAKKYHWSGRVDQPGPNSTKCPRRADDEEPVFSYREICVSQETPPDGLPGEVRHPDEQTSFVVSFWTVILVCLVFIVVVGQVYKIMRNKRKERSTYTKECQSQLLQEFGFLTEDGAAYFVRKYSSYRTCHRVICNLVMGRPVHLRFTQPAIGSPLEKHGPKDKDPSVYATRLKNALDGLIPLTMEQHGRLAAHDGRTTTLRHNRRRRKRDVLDVYHTKIQREVDQCRRERREWLRQATAARREKPQRRTTPCHELAFRVLVNLGRGGVLIGLLVVGLLPRSFLDENPSLVLIAVTIYITCVEIGKAWRRFEIDRPIYVQECKAQLFKDFGFLSEEGAQYFAKSYWSYQTCYRIISNKVMGRPVYLGFNANTTWMRNNDQEYATRLKNAIRGRNPLTLEQHVRLAKGNRDGEWTTLQYCRASHSIPHPVLNMIKAEVYECHKERQEWLMRVAASASKGVTKYSAYVKECKAQLFKDFGFLSDEGAFYYAKEYKSYRTCHRVISNRVMGRSDHLPLTNGQASDEAFVDRLKKAMGGVPLSFEQHERLATNSGQWTTLQYCRLNTPQPHLWVINGEVNTCRKEGLEWIVQINTAAHPKAECLCCFETLRICDMIGCEESGHLFCRDCIKRQVEHQVFSSASFGTDKSTGIPYLETKCMFSSGDCHSSFANLDVVLPKKLKEKYDELKFMASLNLANVPGLTKCPRCPYVAILGPDLDTFPCPKCQATSCRKCGEDPHPGESCATKTKSRTSVEELKSQILIRTCPNVLCQKEMVKESGCNKMKCKCGTEFCYVCRKRILNGYNHFCRTPHCTHESCNKCQLWSSTEQDDKRAMVEAELMVQDNKGDVVRDQVPKWKKKVGRVFKKRQIE